MDELQLLKDIWGEVDKQPTEIKTGFLAIIAKATGLLFGHKKSEDSIKKAEAYLVQQIKNDSNMPPLLKAATISKSKKILREYINQNDIVNMAMDYLTDNAEPDKIETEWLSYFFDNAKHVEKEDIQIIWAKILAKESETSGKFSKRLLQILSTISNYEAELFVNLLKFSYYIDDEIEKDFNILYDKSSNQEIYKDEGIEISKLIRLKETGLIEIDPDGFANDVTTTYNYKQGIKIVYRDESFTFYPNNPKGISTGIVILTDAGASLLGLIEPIKVEGFFNILKNYYEKLGKTV